MNYASSIAFEGSTEKAFDLATVALTSLGFRISIRDRSALDLTGPGLNSSRQSAVLGASRLQFIRGSHELSVTAELGGVERMRRFLLFFPMGLSIGLCVVLSVVFSFVMSDHLWIIPLLAITVAEVLLWLVLAPIIVRSIHARTCQAIDALLNNMVQTGNAV